jgi:GH43 family beta-xylosidase
MTDGDLVKRLRKTTQSGKPTQVSKADRLAAADRIEELEAKLAKAVEGLRDAVDAWDNHNKTGDMMQGHWVDEARALLAEIEGEKG